LATTIFCEELAGQRLWRPNGYHCPYRHVYARAGALGSDG
jgi:hypothetical protein